MSGVSELGCLSIEILDNKLEEMQVELKNRYKTGRGVFVSTRNLICHICIQFLVNLLNFENYINSNKLNINDITISDDNCIFIYNYLQYFELYSFTPDSDDKGKKSIRKIIAIGDDIDHPVAI